MNKDEFMSKPDVLKEFNSNYSEYLENLLIYQSIYEIINQNSKSNNNNQANYKNLSSAFTYKQTDTTANDQKEFQTRETAQNAFWKSHLLGMCQNDNKENVSGFFKLDQLNVNVKHDLLKQLEILFENSLDSIGKFMQIEQSNSNTATTTVDCELIVNEVKALVESINTNKHQINELNETLELKLSNYFHLASELINILVKIFEDFKLQFFTNQDLIKCENLLIQSEMLIAKMQSIFGEYFCDTYANEKLKGLKQLKQLVDLNLSKAREVYAQLKLSHEIYKSLGGEYNELHKQYVKLKGELAERKKILNKCKSYSS